MTTKTTEKKPPRITKAMRLADVKAMLLGEPVSHETTLDMALEVLDKEIDALARKAAGGSKKPTKTQQDNETYKGLILEFLEVQDDGVSCADVYKGVPELAEAGFQIQKAASLLGALKKAGLVYSVEVKGKPMFFYGPKPEDVEE